MVLLPVTSAATHADRVVDPNRSDAYPTITAALRSLPMCPYRRTVILIRDGVYEEKIRITRHYITLRGESRDGTVIRFPQARSDWDRDPDRAGPAVVNIHADDAILDNLTIHNSQPDIGPHAFAVYGGQHADDSHELRCDRPGRGHRGPVECEFN